MKKLVKLISLPASVFYTMFMLMGFAGQASAGPIGTTACTLPANSFTTQVNCGTYIQTVAGNDGGGPITILTNSYTQIAKYDGGTGWSGTTGFSIAGLPSGFPSDNGTWASPFSVMFVVIKASNDYSVYGQGTQIGNLFSGATSGFWATAPNLVNANNGKGKELSHLSFYGQPCVPGTPNCSTPFPVPEPGVLSLLGIGLLGLGLSRRRIKV